MNKSMNADLLHRQSAETTDDIIGILNAISVVSKNMARKLALLEQMSSGKECVREDG